MTYKEKLSELESRHRKERDELRQEYLQYATHAPGEVVIYLANGRQSHHNTIPYYYAIGSITSVDIDDTRNSVVYGMTQVTLTEENQLVQGNYTEKVLEQFIVQKIGNINDNFINLLQTKIKA